MAYVSIIITVERASDLIWPSALVQICVVDQAGDGAAHAGVAVVGVDHGVDLHQLFVPLLLGQTHYRVSGLVIKCVKLN